MRGIIEKLLSKEIFSIHFLFSTKLEMWQLVEVQIIISSFFQKAKEQRILKIYILLNTS